MSFIITGASGQLGRLAAELLVDRVDPDRVVLVTRNPDSLADLAGRGATVRFGDFDEPESLAAAFAGGERLLLISGTELGPRRVQQHQNAIDAAKAAGITHVSYTSIPEPVQDNPAAVVPDHRATEEALAASGLRYPFLRNALYADMRVQEAQGALAMGKLYSNQGDGRTAYVSRQDCAAAAVAVLTGGAEHDDRAYDITGPELLGAAELAAIYARAGGADVELVALDDAAYIAGMAQAGLPQPVAELLASFGTSIREGFADQLTGEVEALTGRAPEPVEPVVVAGLRV
jgi:NAD(P)H dehydrogenase (quinone)